MIHAGDGFRQTFIRILFGKHRLPLQIRCFNEITVNYQQPSDTGSRESFGLRRPQRTATDDDVACAACSERRGVDDESAAIERRAVKLLTIRSELFGDGRRFLDIAREERHARPFLLQTPERTTRRAARSDDGATRAA